MSETQSLFRTDGESYVSTEAAGNPWGELTGGGPVAGLLARAVERSLDSPEWFVARLTVDLIRPVPREPVVPQVRVVHAGKRLLLVEATLTGTEGVLTRCTAQVLRRGEAAGIEPSALPFAGPEGIAAGSLIPPEFELRWGVHDVIDVRWLADQSSPDTSRVWMRMPIPLLAGEPLSPLVRTATLADCISAASPAGKLFGPWINTDISLYLHRDPAGEWLGMEIKRDVEATGVGVARARLFDRHGPVGSASEAVLINQLG